MLDVIAWRGMTRLGWKDPMQILHEAVSHDTHGEMKK